jgi:hypothetical protein
VYAIGNARIVGIEDGNGSLHRRARQEGGDRAFLGCSSAAEGSRQLRAQDFSQDGGLSTIGA